MVDFKPTSISQIATSSDNKKQNIYEAEPLQSSETLENNELENVKKALDNGPSDSGDNPNNADIESSLQENQQEKEKSDPSENSSKNLDLSDDPTKEDKKDSEAVNLNKEPEAISPDALPQMNPLSVKKHLLGHRKIPIRMSKKQNRRALRLEKKLLRKNWKMNSKKPWKPLN